MTKYDCNWVYSVFPTRVELQVTDRETGDILFDEVLRKFNTAHVGMYNDESMVAEIKPIIRIYDYKTSYNKKYDTTNYTGKGTFIKEEK